MQSSIIMAIASNQKLLVKMHRNEVPRDWSISMVIVEQEDALRSGGWDDGDVVRMEEEDSYLK